jgi:nucleotide sugar dehydrogenase
MAAVMADVGFEIYGIERRQEVLDRLADHDAPFFERGLSSLLRKVRERLHFSQKIPEDCPATIYIITVGTPLDGESRVNLSAIRDAAEMVANRLKDGDMVVLRSTVKLGTTAALAAEVLERSGRSYDLAFCPERTSEGQALLELRSLPQIVGSPDVGTRERAARVFNRMTATVVHVDSLEGAELIKLIDNSYRDTMFAFANEVARICDAVGLDAGSVINAGNLGYPRTNVLKPGTVGGPCLEKDPHLLIEGLKPFGITPELIATARMINERQPGETVEQIRQVATGIPGFPARPRIAVLGLAFKGRPETDDLRGTTTLLVFRALQTAFPSASFRCFDPVVDRQEAERMFETTVCTTVEEACEGANLVLIANNHHAFADMEIDRVANGMGRPALIYDYWSNFRVADLDLPTGVRYATLGGIAQARSPQPR